MRIIRPLSEKTWTSGHFMGKSHPKTHHGSLQHAQNGHIISNRRADQYTPLDSKIIAFATDDIWCESNIKHSHYLHSQWHINTYVSQLCKQVYSLSQPITIYNFKSKGSFKWKQLDRKIIAFATGDIRCPGNVNRARSFRSTSRTSEFWAEPRKSSFYRGNHAACLFTAETTRNLTFFLFEQSFSNVAIALLQLTSLFMLIFGFMVMIYWWK